MATLHGKGGAFAISVPGASAAVITEVREWQFEIDRELDEDFAMGDTWRTQLSGLLSWRGSVEANFDTAQTLLFAAAIASAASSGYWYPEGTGTARYYYGLIWPKLSATIGNAVGRATFDFEGDGAFAQKV